MTDVSAWFLRLMYDTQTWHIILCASARHSCFESVTLFYKKLITRWDSEPELFFTTTWYIIRWGVGSQSKSSRKSLYSATCVVNLSPPPWRVSPGAVRPRPLVTPLCCRLKRSNDRSGDLRYSVKPFQQTGSATPKTQEQYVASRTCGMTESLVVADSHWQRWPHWLKLKFHWDQFHRNFLADLLATSPTLS